MPLRSLGLASLLIGSVLLCCFGTPLMAVSNVRYSVDVWGTKEGLPQNSVITMVQTRNGYLWFGTLNGLVRFDGIQFTVFDESNTPGLHSSRVVKVFEDSQRNLWIGTETAGAARIKSGKVTSLDLGQGRREGMLKSVCEDSTGGIWLYTADGELARYRDGKVDVWNVAADRFSDCRSVITDGDQIWIGSDQSLFSVIATSVSSSESLPVGTVVPVRKLDFLLASQSDGHWRLVDGHIQRWKAGEMLSSWPYPWRVGTFIRAACEDQDGNLIVGTRGEGLFWFDANGGVQHISKADGLSDHSVLSLHADADGSLWVGTDGGGLNRLKQQVFKPLQNSIGLTVQSAAEDADGGIWFSSNNQGIDYWKEEMLTRFGLSGYNVRPVLIDQKQRLWLGTFGVGLFRFENGSFRRAPGAESVHRQVSVIHEDRLGRIWVGTEGGLARWDENEWKLYTTQDGLSSNLIRAIADDESGNIWIGTERGGLNRLRNEQFVSFQQTNGFPSDNLSALHVDKQGVIWIGTFGSGLIRFHKDKWVHYTTREGLISNGVDYLIEDDQGCLWIGSNTGLMRVPKKALNDFAAGEIDFVPCRGFGEPDGLPASECTVDSQPAAFRSRDGNLWFPTIAGLAFVDPGQFQIRSNPPPVMIESVLIEGREQNTNGIHGRILEAVVVPAGKDHLDIHYTSLNLAAPNRARFKYRLEGHEEDWINVGNRRVASYTKLPPGKYEFQVTACNEDGIWNPVGTHLAVTVLPPFWRTWWFLSAVILALLGMIVAVVHFISTQKLQRELNALQQQQALEKERARIARDIHDQVGASLTQVSLLGEMVESDKDLPEEVEAHGRQITQTARETAHALDEIVWTVNPSNDTLDGLINYICKHAQEYLAVAGLRYRLEVPAELPPASITPEARHNVFLAAKEAVTNIVRHAKANEAWVRLHLAPGKFTLEIEDDGRGPGDVTSAAAQARNGLSNMRKRMEDIGGKFFIGAGQHGGTVVRLTVPINHT